MMFSGRAQGRDAYANWNFMNNLRSLPVGTETRWAVATFDGKTILMDIKVVDSTKQGLKAEAIFINAMGESHEKQDK